MGSAYNATDIGHLHTYATLEHFQGSPYNYIPTLWICALFIALFSLSGLLHLTEAIYTRLWFFIPTAVLANIAEVIGWAGRLWSAKNPTLLDPYLMQIVTTIIAPTPLVAAEFVILGELIKRLGSRYSRLSPMWYTIVFVSCDIIALVIQAVGGAKAATAVQNYENPDTGGNIMLGGIAFQLAAISIYVMLAAEFLYRYIYDLPLRKTEIDQEKPRDGNRLDLKTKMMIIGLGFSSTAIFIRSVYRTIELADGWSGRIISTQVYFNVLDGAMIVLATFCLNILHPGFLIARGSEWGKVVAGAPGQSEVKRSSDSDTMF